MSSDLIGTARRLAKASPQRPRQADLKRAVSTAYYALFHGVARDAADCLIGTGQNQAEQAWTQTYRALSHGDAKNACYQVRNLGFPADLRVCADAFVTLQEAREAADYDPNFRLSRAEALAAIAHAEQGIAALKRSTKKDRKTFAALLLFRKRKQLQPEL